jgi:hypothetical protein
LWIDSIIEEDKEKVRSCIPETITKDVKEITFPDYRIKKSDGAIKWISARAFPIFDSEGNPDRIAGVAEDITGRKQAEAQREAAFEALQKKIDELERWQSLTVGRELMMIELKKEINALLEQIGQPQKYKIADGTR